MPYIVVFTPEAEAQLTELYGYIAVAASPDIAARYTDATVTYCESLRTFPHRGISRDAVRVLVAAVLVRHGEFAVRGFHEFAFMGFLRGQGRLAHKKSRGQGTKRDRKRRVQH